VNLSVQFDRDKITFGIGQDVRNWSDQKWDCRLTTFLLHCLSLREVTAVGWCNIQMVDVSSSNPKDRNHRRLQWNVRIQDSAWVSLAVSQTLPAAPWVCTLVCWKTRWCEGMWMCHSRITCTWQASPTWEEKKIFRVSAAIHSSRSLELIADSMASSLVWNRQKHLPRNYRVRDMRKWDLQLHNNAGC